MNNLFQTSQNHNLTPLAERCRPQKIDDYKGQKHLLGEGKIIRIMLEKNNFFSMIFWGLPGCGKTTLAQLIARHANMDAHYLSAISAGVADVRKVIMKGKHNKAVGVRTLLFIDEIHRFNKAQQDAVLGAVEAGEVVLIGATTENPSFRVISPLLSRTRVLKLNSLTIPELKEVMQLALSKDIVLSQSKITFEDGVEDKIFHLAQGDARRLLNLLELSLHLSEGNNITDNVIKEALKDISVNYDQLGEKHYDTISAFIKSMRGSDPNAAVYYLARMIDGGEDPIFIARRMVIFASEDIGNASPQALNLATSTMTAVSNIGMPEARIILSQCAIFLASAPKSNASYVAINKALELAKDYSLEIPLHLRNAPTELMSDLGYGKGYKYPHDYPYNFVSEDYLPEKIKDIKFYDPTEQGSEHSIKKRLSHLWPDKYQVSDSE